MAERGGEEWDEKSQLICYFNDYIQALKGRSARLIRSKYKDYLDSFLWGKHFWSPSYFLATTGNVTIDVLKQYIEEQRENQE